MIKSPRFHPGIDPDPSFSFDDLCGTERSFLHFLSLCRRAVTTSIMPGRLRLCQCSAVFFPMHQTKFAQMVPIEAALGSDPLFILASWDSERIRKFNGFVRDSERKWVMLEPVFPKRFWLDLIAGFPYWAAIVIRSPRMAARRLAQFFELYGVVHGISRIVSSAKAKTLITAYEDSWYSSAVSQYAKRAGYLTINVMHGNCYRHDQFFDASLVFGEYHKSYLEAHTASKTRFVISGSATIRDTGAPPKPELADRLIYFDQPVCETFPASVKTEVMRMLATLLAGLDGAILSVKPHPSGMDACLEGFLRVHPSARLIPANAPKSVAEVLSEQGISLTAFSTTGLEAISNGTVSLFLNPDGALSFGPLAFMGEFAVHAKEDLLRLVSRLITDGDHYSSFLLRQKGTLERHYALGPFDYAGFLRGLGLFEESLGNL